MGGYHIKIIWTLPILEKEKLISIDQRSRKLVIATLSSDLVVRL